MFVKVFSQIFDSSIAENYELRHFFEDMLKLADIDGVVDMTPEAIHRRINLPLVKVISFIADLSKPDEKSRSPEHEGRRIIPLDSHRDWGWIVVNYQHYRMLRDEDARRAYFRDAKRKQRETKPAKKKPVADDVTKAGAIAAERLPRQRLERPTIEMLKLQAAKIGLAEVEADKFFNYYESNGWRVGRNPMKSWPHALTNWKNNLQNYGSKNTAKVNPRNAGMGETAETKSSQTVAVLARRDAERRASEPMP
jgi:hypothetical protein